MKMIMKSVALLLLCTGVLQAQEGLRAIQGAGKFAKYLTPGLLDRWIIEGKKGETIIAHVSTNEFDPVLELALHGGGEKEDSVFFSIDDKGGESRFSFRLPEDGKYAIRVHAYKFMGGGNYSLKVRRFEASPLEINQQIIGTINRDGNSYWRFKAEKNQILTINAKGASLRPWELLDVKGKRVSDWSDAVTIEEDGEYSLIITGSRASRYELVIKTVSQRKLVEKERLKGSLEQNELDVWNFEGKPGDFRLIIVEQQGRIASRLIYAPVEKKDIERIPKGNELPEIQFVPITSKGRFTRFAAMFGRTGRYQLQIAAKSKVSYTLEMGDPSMRIKAGQDLEGTLLVGGSAFYCFHASPGQLLSMGLKSEQFDPTLTLYNHQGDQVASNDDGHAGVGSLITHMVVKEGVYRLHVASLGGGGGGGYRIGLYEQELGELEIDGRARGALESGATDFWKFTGRENLTVLISVRSNACDPKVSLYSPDGVRLASDDNGGVGADSLFAVKLPQQGAYILWISSEQGAGEYTVRLIDGD